MARKIFVSYKHRDHDVYPLNHPFTESGTVRDYVDYTQYLFDGEEIYKGEHANEDLSQFKEDSIRTHLKDKIFDSSVTVVFISPNMVDRSKPEKDQFIPWEISYALQNRKRGERVSTSNAVLAVVLPDRNGSYSYFLYQKNCGGCKSVSIMTDRTFSIIGQNMFNRKRHPTDDCAHCLATTYRGAHSYIPYTTWDSFKNDPDHHISQAQERRDLIDEYEIVKQVSG